MVVEPPARYFNTERQDVVDTAENLINPLILFTAVLGFQLGSLLIGNTNDKLENDPQCGLVTGGKEECYWDCYNQDVLALQIATNIQCIADCIPSQCEAIPSISSIIEEIESNQVCEGSLLHQFLELRNVNIQTRPCKYFLGVPFFLAEGTCALSISTLTEVQALSECLGAVLTLPPVVVDTIFAFVTSSCSVKLPEPTQPACYSTCEFITVHGFQTNIVEDIQCLRGCFDNSDILTLYDRVQEEGVCQQSPIQFLKANVNGQNETSCVFPDISADTTELAEILVNIYTSLLQLPLSLLGCALQILLRGGVLGSLSVCSSIINFSLGMASSVQLGPQLSSLPEFVVQSNLVWFLSTSVFSSVSSLVFETYTQVLLPFNITGANITLPSISEFILPNFVCFINPSPEDQPLAFSDVLDCLGIRDSFSAQFSETLCEHSLLHLAFLALNITVNTQPCSYFLGLPFMPIEGTCNVGSSFDFSNIERLFGSVIPIFALTIAWTFNSCSFGLPAAPFFTSTPNITINPLLANNSFSIDLSTISSCQQAGMLEEIFANLTTNLIRQNVPLQQSDAEFLRRELSDSARRRRSPRLPPIVSATETSGTRLEFENTKHRYSWICSLRRKLGKQHLCSVTILSRPPKPTVIVGAAHCTFLCKNSEDQTILPDCCCGGGATLGCSTDLTKCPGRAAVVEMTGEDAEILCGEWQTGDIPPEESQEEEFNILLPIVSIIRHPDYTIGNTGSAFLADDVAVFKVNDTELSDEAVRHRVIPVCLPREPLRAEEGVHAGWTTPPPAQFVEEVAPGYQKFFPDLAKQWHYKMRLTSCSDVYTEIFPELSASQTFYPGRTVCARDKTNSSCFYSGSSGSPLMLRETARPERFYMAGGLSYINGCDYFYLGQELIQVNVSGIQAWVLSQKSQNPAVYSSLACYLPWIAEQYDLSFDSPTGCEATTSPGSGGGGGGGGDDGRCLTVPEFPFQLTLSYQGSELLEILAATSWISIENFSQFTDSFFTPLPCIFPFYLDNQFYDSCIFLEKSDFKIPVFFCPVRNVTTKISGVNSFSSSDLDRLLYIGFCEEKEKDEAALLPDLDPTCFTCPLPRVAFAACTNNCPGVTFPIVSGGTALVFAAGTASFFSSPLIPAMLGLGVVGLGGLGTNMLASSACVGPLYCRAASGQCCLLLINTLSFICPTQC